MMAGYAHPAYAAALSDYGQPRALPLSRGHILVSPIRDIPSLDARGCYPLFACADWSRLPDDLEAVGRDLISLVLVADPFGSHEHTQLAACFPDLCIPFKEHFVVDLEQPFEARVSPHHARNIRKATQTLEVEVCADPLAHSDDWVRLYGNLVNRHQIRGLAAFSAQSLVCQLQVPGLVMLRALHGGETAGIILWYVHGNVAYYHLAAYSDLGYNLRASFALFAHSMQYFSTRVRWLNLGAGAGVHASDDDGLTRFKRGWATGTRTAYLCGRIFDRERYDEIVRLRGVTGTGFFPLYRKGELS